MNKFLYFFLLLILILTSGCEQRKEQFKPSGRVVKIGFIAPMSGPEKHSGENAILGVRTALEMQPYLNNGDKVELVIQDNKGNAENTVTALEKLRDQEDVAGVLLMANSDIALSLVPLADDYGIPILALIATHPDITKNNQFIIQLGFDDVHQGKVAALYVRDEMLIQRVAVMSNPNISHYSFLANAFIQEFTGAGGEIVQHVVVSPGTAKFGDILKQLKEDNVRLLYLAISPSQVVETARRVRDIGWKPKMMGSDGMMATILLKHKEDISLVDGMLATDFYSSILPKTVYGKQAVRVFKKLHSEHGTSYAVIAAEGTSILQNAMNQCNSDIDRACVNLKLRNTEGFEGIFGNISIKNNGKTERPVIMNIIQDKEMKFLVKVY